MDSEGSSEKGRKKRRKNDDLFNLARYVGSFGTRYGTRGAAAATDKLPGFPLVPPANAVEAPASPMW